ncbi:MAG: hypothetical protein ACREV5_19545 [Steroidobacter sp.]
MAKRNNRALKVAAGVAVSFTSLVVFVLVLAARRIVTFQMALLMLVGLFGLYLGFGVLIAVYRFTGKLQ